MKYICELCGLIYDEEQGDPRNGIAPGTAFTELPSDYECPGCYSERQAYSMVGQTSPLPPVTVPEGSPIQGLYPKQESDR